MILLRQEYVMHPPSPHCATAPTGQCHFIVEASRSYSDTPHMVALLWTSDRPEAETSNGQDTILAIDSRAPGRIRNRVSSKRAAADLRIRLRGHRDWLHNKNTSYNKVGPKGGSDYALTVTYCGCIYSNSTKKCTHVY